MNVGRLTQPILHQVKIMFQSRGFKILRVGIPADSHIWMIGYVKNRLDRWQLRALAMNFQSDLLAKTRAIFSDLI